MKRAYSIPPKKGESHDAFLDRVTSMALTFDNEEDRNVFVGADGYVEINGKISSAKEVPPRVMPDEEKEGE